MSWRHWQTGDIWPDEGTYIYHLLMQPQVYSEKTRDAFKNYWDRQRNGYKSKTYEVCVEK